MTAAQSEQWQKTEAPVFTGASELTMSASAL